MLSWAEILLTLMTPLNWDGMLVTRVKPLRIVLKLCCIWLVKVLTRGFVMVTVAAIEIVVLKLT